MTIGQKIQTLRKIHGFTQSQFGQALGFSKSTADVRVAQYETGFRNPKKQTLEKIAVALNVSITTFLPESPVNSAIQEVVWLSPEDRLEVEIAMEELNKMEEALVSGDIHASELALWKFQWRANNTIREEHEWN